MKNAATLSGTPRERLTQASNLSRSESSVASWIDVNLADIPFGSAADLAKGAGVSEMSVSRFIHRLGYDNFKAFRNALKLDLHTDAALEDRFSVPKGTSDELNEQMQLEVQSIVEVYTLASTPVWDAALDVVHKSKRVNVTGFQGSKGLALDFATRLKYAREWVRFAEGTSGNWSEIFAEGSDDSCLVMVDTVAYDTRAFRIAELCLRRDIPLIMVTDKFSQWPRKYTPYVLAVNTASKTYWDSTSGLSALLGLFLNGITARIGSPAKERLEVMTKLGEHFDAYANEPTQVRPLRQDRKEKSE